LLLVDLFSYSVSNIGCGGCVATRNRKSGDIASSPKCHQVNHLKSGEDLEVNKISLLINYMIS